MWFRRVAGGSQERLLRALRWASVLALSALAALSVASALMTSRKLLDGRGSAQTINVAGRQRMLTQRVAWSAQRLVGAGRPDAGEARTMLRQALADLRASDALLRSAGPGLNQGRFTAIETVSDPAVMALVERFTQAAQVILDTPSAELGQRDPQLRVLEAAAGGPLLDALEGDVAARTREEEASTDRLVTQAMIRLGLTLGLLLGLGLLVFRPLERRARRALVSAARERDFARSVTDAMGQGLVLNTLDGRLDYADPAFARLLGRAPDELSGHLWSEVVGGAPPQAASSGEGQLQPLAGSPLPALLTTVPHDLRGTPGFLTVVTDLRERDARERQVLAHDAQYRLLAAHFPQGAVLLFDHELRYRVADGAGLSLVNLSPQELRGRALREVFRPKVADLIEPAHLAALRGESRVSEQQFAGRTFLMQTLPLPADDSGPRGMLIVQDVSELVRARQEAEQAREAALTLASLTRTLQDVHSFEEVTQRAFALLRPAVEARWIALARVEGQSVRGLAMQGRLSAEAEAALLGGALGTGEGLWDEALKGPVYLSDGAGKAWAPAELLGAAGLAVVPLPDKPERGPVVLLVGRSGAAPWSSQQRALLESGARSICASWERVALHRDLQASEAYARALLEVSRLAESGLGGEELAQRVVQTVARVAGVDWGALVVVRGDEARTLTAWASPAAGALGDGQIRSLPRGSGVVWQAYDRHEATFVDDYAAHPDAAPGLINLGVRSACWVSLARVDGGGYLLVATRHQASGGWSGPEQELFAAAARGVAAALQRDAHLEALEASALTDALTRLGNRRAFDADLEVLERQSGRGEGGYGVLMVDLDGLKRVNDTQGHAAGDLLLRAFADALRAQLRQEDQVYRLGGDEFAVLLPGTSGEHLEAVMRRLQRAAEQLRAGGYPALDASAGAAFCPADSLEAPALVVLADARMYAHKHGKPGRVHA